MFDKFIACIKTISPFDSAQQPFLPIMALYLIVMVENMVIVVTISTINCDIKAKIANESNHRKWRHCGCHWSDENGFQQCLLQWRWRHRHCMVAKFTSLSYRRQWHPSLPMKSTVAIRIHYWIRHPLWSLEHTLPPLKSIDTTTINYCHCQKTWQNENENEETTGMSAVLNINVGT